MSSQLYQFGTVPLPVHNGSKLILSVDDEPVILFTREKILQAEGYDVLSAPDGKKALEVFDAHPVALVLLDYIMPGTDGGRISQTMKAHKPFVPVIMVSGNFLPEEAIICADRFLAKGDGPEFLLAAIKQVLSPTVWKKQLDK
jgi:two-component system, OmpR family, response regulator